MLILSRRAGEAIFIGDDIEIHVLHCKTGQARLGIKAPDKIPVHRKEIYDRIKAEQAADKDSSTS